MAEAGDSVAAAKKLLDDGYIKYAASRAYYAMFYVAQALLEGEGVITSTHKGVLTRFGSNLVQTGKIPAEFHKMLVEAERLRNQADYGPRSSVTLEKTQKQIVRAERFLELGNHLIVQPAFQQEALETAAAVRQLLKNYGTANSDGSVTFEATNWRFAMLLGDIVTIATVADRREILRVEGDKAVVFNPNPEEREELKEFRQQVQSDRQKEQQQQDQQQRGRGQSC